MFALPRIVRELVREAARADPSLQFVAELGRGDHLVGRVQRTPGRVAVVSGASLSEQEIASVFSVHPDARVLELVDDGRETFLYELRPHRVKLGQVSPRSLVDWIRSPSSQVFVSEAY